MNDSSLSWMTLKKTMNDSKTSWITLKHHKLILTIINNTTISNESYSPSKGIEGTGTSNKSVYGLNRKLCLLIGSVRLPFLVPKLGLSVTFEFVLIRSMTEDVLN